MTQTTPTRDEAVLRYYADTFCELGPHHECCGKLSKDECSGCLARSTLASAPAPAICNVVPPPETYGGSPDAPWTGQMPPAPASGRVDAGLPGPNKQLDRVRIGEGEYVRADEAIKTVMELQRQLYDADKRLASLSPAETPVSEAGPVATERPYWRDYPADQKVSPALAFDGGCLTINGQGYGDRDGAGVFAFKDDDLRWGHGEDEGYRYVHVGKSDLEAIRQAIASAHGPYALAKPASSPAGGDVVEAHATKALMKAIQRAEDGAGTISAKEAVKLRPADWHAVCDRARKLAALSQSTSAGRVGE